MTAVWRCRWCRWCGGTDSGAGGRRRDWWWCGWCRRHSVRALVVAVVTAGPRDGVGASPWGRYLLVVPVVPVVRRVVAAAGAGGTGGDGR